jgi:hypothetical protein
VRASSAARLLLIILLVSLVVAACGTIAPTTETPSPTATFSYGRADPYPYTYMAVPRMLENAAYEAVVDLGPGVICFRLSKDGQPIYLPWSDAEERTVDLSGELSGQVRVTDAAGGESMQGASSLRLTAEPLFVEPAR